MDIKSLPKDVRAQLRSGANINSILQCVTELVLNSLDAKSTAIAIRVNLLTFRIQVVDNGKGITKSNMNLIGIRYMTSKCQSLADLKKIKGYGFRGEALASIRKISKKINITSRPENVENTYSKTYANSKWDAVELVKERPSKGTTVTIEGFMHNLPVRQKRIDQNLDMNEIKRMLEGLAIIHPNISYNLRNDATGKLIFQSNKTQTVAEALVNLYPDIISSESLLDIKITKNKISVSGLISKNRSSNTKFQFIYLNKRQIIAPKIQKLVNTVLLKSLIYRTLSSDHDNFLNPNGKTEHPIYVLNITCPYSEVDLTLSPTKKTVEFKRWDVVLKYVEKAMVKLLERENLINVDASKEEVDLPAAPSFKSQFGVSQIHGAVKSIPVKRKMVKNGTESVKKRSKEVNETCSGGNIANMPNIEGDHVKIMTVAEVHNEGKIVQKKKLKVLLSDKDKKCKKNVRPTTDEIKDRMVNEKSREDRNTNRKTCYKILPEATKYYKNKNVKGRPTLLENTKTEMGPPGINYKKINSAQNKEKNYIKTKEKCNIQNISGDDILNSQKNDLISITHDLETKSVTNHGQNIHPKNIFDKHKNTQSLVLNSEVNTTKTELNPLLNSTINTNLLQNQEKGKELVMDIFLKSTLVFPNEEPVVKDLPPVKTMVVETTKENLVTERRNHNATMMTMSWKIMSKKTIVTNSVHPVCNVDENKSKRDHKNDGNERIKECDQNNRPKENPKEKMVSKCIQTTMIEHQKEFKIDLNFDQAEPETNSKFTFYNPPIDKYNVTFSKYFEKSSRREQKKTEKFHVPESHFRNDFKINSDFCSFEELKHSDFRNFGLKGNHYWENNKPTLDFGKNPQLNNIRIPQFGPHDYLHGHRPSHNYRDQEDYLHDFPQYNKSHKYHRNINPFTNCNNEIFSNNHINGKNFRKPIKKYFSDYNFDFSNLNVCGEPYRQFLEQTHNPKRHRHYNPLGRKTNPSRIPINPQGNKYNIKNGYFGDGIIPLYQCYNKSKLGQDWNYMQDKPMNNHFNINNWHEDFQHPNRNKTERYLYPKNVDGNCRSTFNNNFWKEMENESDSKEQLYKSIYRDYGQESYFHDQRMDEHVMEEKNGIFKVPKLENRHYMSKFATNTCLNPFQTKSNILKQKSNGAAHFNLPKNNIGEEKCYSPFFQKPITTKECYTKMLAHNNRKAAYHNEANHQYVNVIKNMENPKISRMNQNLFRSDGIDCVSPFFHKKSKEVPIINTRKTNLVHKNQCVPKEVPTNRVRLEPISKSSQTDDQLDFTFVIPSTERIMVPRQQYTNDECLLFQKHEKQSFPFPKTNNLLKMDHLMDHTEDQYTYNESLLLENPEKQPFFLTKQDTLFQRGNLQVQTKKEAEKNPESKQNQPLQEFTRSYTKKPKNVFKKQQDGENKWQNGLYVAQPHDEQPTREFTFSTEKAQPNWQLMNPNINKHFHKKTKPLLRKFNTEPPQSHPKPFFKTLSYIPQTNLDFQQKTEPAFKTFAVEPNICKNIQKFPSNYIHNSPFNDLTTPQCNKQMEYSFMTQNINKSTVNDDDTTNNTTTEKITLDDSENFNFSTLDEIEEQNNLTVCFENFNPALSSTRVNAFEENSINALNSPSKIQKLEIAHEDFDLNSDIIETTPKRNFNDFFVPSLSLFRVNRQENAKSNSVQNISISAIKKSQLVQKDLANDCKLNRESVSCESELLRNNFLSSEDWNMTESLINKNVAVVEHQNENDFEQMETEDEWIEKTDTFGRVFYIHKRTGMVSMFRPQQDTQFDLVKRIEFVPKGLSPIFIQTKKLDVTLSPTSKKSLHAAILENYENELNTIKWSNYIYDYNDANAFFEELYREKTKKFECQIPNANLSKFPKSMIKLHNNIQAQSFTKDIFTELEIIGQVDNKFITAIMKSKRLIILFDQHAVHERVRLEELLNGYTEKENNTDIIKFKSTKCYERFIIKLTPSDLNILSNFKNLFENLGLQYTIFANNIQVTHIPTCIYNKFKEKNKEGLEDNINSLIQEQIDMVTSTRGVSSKIPNLLQNIINSEACRGAIKFGDYLTLNECEKYITELSVCQLPFQCAHGRPTLVPIVTVNPNLDTMKPNLKKLKGLIKETIEE